MHRIKDLLRLERNGAAPALLCEEYRQAQGEADFRILALL